MIAVSMSSLRNFYIYKSSIAWNYLILCYRAASSSTSINDGLLYSGQLSKSYGLNAGSTLITQVVVNYNRSDYLISNLDLTQWAYRYLQFSPLNQNYDLVVVGCWAYNYASSISKSSGISPSKYQSILAISTSVSLSSFLSSLFVYLHTQCYRNDYILSYQLLMFYTFWNQLPLFFFYSFWRQIFYFISLPIYFYFNSLVWSVRSMITYFARSLIQYIRLLFYESSQARKFSMLSYLLKVSAIIARNQSINPPAPCLMRYTTKTNTFNLFLRLLRSNFISFSLSATTLRISQNFSIQQELYASSDIFLIGITLLLLLMTSQNCFQI